MNTAYIFPAELSEERKSIAERLLNFICTASDADVVRINDVVNTTASIREADRLADTTKEED